MTPKIVDVEATDNHTLIATFEDSSIKEFDIKPYLEKGIFTELQEIGYFKSLKIVHGGVQWPNEQDLSFDTIYYAGKELPKTLLK